MSGESTQTVTESEEMFLAQYEQLAHYLRKMAEAPSVNHTTTLLEAHEAAGEMLRIDTERGLKILSVLFDVYQQKLASHISAVTRNMTGLNSALFMRAGAGA